MLSASTSRSSRCAPTEAASFGVMVSEWPISWASVLHAWRSSMSGLIRISWSAKLMNPFAVPQSPRVTLKPSTVASSASESHSPGGA